MARPVSLLVRCGEKTITTKMGLPYIHRSYLRFHSMLFINPYHFVLQVRLLFHTFALQIVETAPETPSNLPIDQTPNPPSREVGLLVSRYVYSQLSLQSASNHQSAGTE